MDKWTDRQLTSCRISICSCMCSRSSGVAAECFLARRMARGTSGLGTEEFCVGKDRKRWRKMRWGRLVMMSLIVLSASFPLLHLVTLSHALFSSFLSLSPFLLLFTSFIFKWLVTYCWSWKGLYLFNSKGNKHLKGGKQMKNKRREGGWTVGGVTYAYM